MPDSTVNLDTSTPSRDSMPRASLIPNGILNAGLLSSTSKAADCFVQQQFSAKLQAFMIGYCNSIMSYYSVYK